MVNCFQLANTNCLTAVFSVCVATSIYFAEGEGNPASEFRSIPSSIWWSFITISTIGYGDIVPKTGTGKCKFSSRFRNNQILVIGCIASIAGIICLSLPLPAIVQNFHKVHALESHKKFSERVFTQLKLNKIIKQRVHAEHAVLNVDKSKNSPVPVSLVILYRLL